MRLAVIPARGGSKRIPRKNVRLFAGKPMLAYAIEVAQRAGVFERIVVSTDDDEIATVARAHGAEVPFVRPPELADDHAGTVPVIAHAIAALTAAGAQLRQVCCIYPGVPLLDAQDLREALALLESGQSGFAFPVLRFESPVQRALALDDQGRVQPMFPAHATTRTQDLAPAFHDAGQFYWGTAAAWLSGRSPHLEGRCIVLPADRAVDIDTPDDWLRAERLFAKRAARAACPQDSADQKVYP